MSRFGRLRAAAFGRASWFLVPIAFAPSLPPAAAVAAPPPPRWAVTMVATGPGALAALIDAIPRFSREGIVVHPEWGTPGVMRPGSIRRVVLTATSTDRAALARAAAGARGFATAGVAPVPPSLPFSVPRPAPFPLAPAAHAGSRR